jgi:RNA polymerase sigma-70 factor (ECF subfamily)
LFFKRKANYSEDDLPSVIAACLEMDQLAQKALIKLFFGFAKSISLRYSSNEYEAEEIINDGFMKVFDNLSRYDHSQPFKAWLRTIMINTSIDYFRKTQKYRFQVDIYDVDVSDFSYDIISKISADEILGLVQKLPPSYRMVFTLYVVDGYTHREIADMMGIKEGTSKSNLQDARRKLQLMIKDNFPHLHLAYGIKINKFNEN